MQRNPKTASAIPPQYPLSKFKKQYLFQPQHTPSQLQLIKKFLQDHHNNSIPIKNVMQLNQIFRSVWIYKCASLSNALLYITMAFKKQKIFESWRKVVARQKRNTPPNSQRFRKQYQLTKALERTKIDVDNNNPISQLKTILQRLFNQPDTCPQALLNITQQSQSKQLFYNQVINPKSPQNLKYLTINIVQKSGLTKLKQNTQTYIFDNSTRYCHLYIFPSYLDVKIQGIKGCWFVLIQSFNRNKLVDNGRLWTRQRFVQHNFIKQYEQEQQVQLVQQAHPQKNIKVEQYLNERINTKKQTSQTNSNIFPQDNQQQRSSQQQFQILKSKVSDKIEIKDNIKKISRIIIQQSENQQNIQSIQNKQSKQSKQNKQNKQGIFTKLTKHTPIIITGIIFGLTLYYFAPLSEQFCRLVSQSCSD